MSFQAVAWVLDHSPAELAERLVLLSIAHHADAEPRAGAWEAYPGIATIKREAGVRRDNTVNDVIARLVAKEMIERVVNGAPDERLPKNRRPNLYRIMLSGGRPCRSSCCLCAPPPDGTPTVACPPVSPRSDPPADGGQIIIDQSSKEILPSSGSPAPRPEIDDLCEFLANAIAGHRRGIRPKITERWRKDMRLLVDRGPLHIDNAEPVTPDRVRVSVAFVFTHLAEPTGRDGFCWADQIRSPHALRDHWAQLADAARRLRNKRRDPLAPGTMEPVADPLAGPQLALSRGGDRR